MIRLSNFLYGFAVLLTHRCEYRFCELRLLEYPWKTLSRSPPPSPITKEEIGSPVAPITAALISADKSDAYRTGPSAESPTPIFTTGSVPRSPIRPYGRPGEGPITLNITLDTSKCQVMTFGRFTSPGWKCPNRLRDGNCRFRLVINGLRCWARSIRFNGKPRPPEARTSPSEDILQGALAGLGSHIAVADGNERD